MSKFPRTRASSAYSGMKSIPKSAPRRGPGFSGEQPKSFSGAKATNIENQFRYALLRKNLNFIEQASIGPWSIDFYLPEHDIVIEADGEFWHSSTKAKMKDRRKDAWLQNKGYKVFHFTGKEIIENPNFCVEKIMKSINGENSAENIIEENKEKDSLQNDEDYERWIRGQ